MKLLRLVLENFAGVEQREIALDPEGITVIQGPNESGKSTLLRALDLLFDTKDGSQAAAVKSVQPVGRDVGPSVLAEFATGSHHITYRKQWLHGARTEARITGPQGTETLTGTQAHDRVSAILAQTMDLALWKALRVQQGFLGQGDTLSDSTALRRALDAASEGGLGGTQEQALLDRARVERDTYLTAKTGRPTGPYREALERRARIQAERDALGKRLEDLQQLIAAIPRAAAEVGALREALDVAKARLAEAEARGLELEQQKTAVAERGRRAATAAQQRTVAATNLEQRRQRTAAVVRAARRMEEVALRRAELPDLALLREDLIRRDQRVTEARAAFEATREAVDTAQHDLDHLRRAQDAAALGARLKAARAAAEQLAKARQSLDRMRVTAEMLARLEQAQQQHHVVAAQEQVQLPQIVLRAHADLRLTVGGEARHLAAGASAAFPVTGQLELDVPGTLRLSVSGGTAVEEVHRRTLEAAGKLSELLAEAGVPHLAAARDQWNERTRAEGDAERAARDQAAALAGATFADLERKEAAARARMEAYLAERRAELPPPATEAEADARRRQARSAHEQAGNGLEAVQADQQTAREALTEAAAHHTGLDDEAERASAEKREADARLEAERRDLPDEALEAEDARAADEQTQAHKEYEDAEAAYRAQDPDAAARLLRSARSALSGMEKRLSEAGDHLSEQRGALRAVQSDGLEEKHADACAQCEAAALEADRLGRNARAADLLCRLLEARRAEAFRQYQDPYRRALERLGRTVYGPGFSVELNEELVIQRRVLRGTSLAFEQLSTGTQEQMAILARLAAAELISDEGVPVILDDSFGYSDPARLESLSAVLHMVGERCQILLLTCSPTRYAMVGDAGIVRLDAPAASAAAALAEVAAARE